MGKKKTGNGQSLRFSIRIAGVVTSISLRKNIVALWLCFCSEEEWHNTTSDFIYKCLNKWKEDNAKGFSDFVTDRMIADILEDDVDVYRDLLAEMS